MTLVLDKSTWNHVSFGDVVTNVNDYFDASRDGVLPYVAGPHINGGEPTVAAYGSTDDDGFPPTFKRKFRPGDVLLHSRGIEKLAAVDRVGVTGEKLFVLRSRDTGTLLQEYLIWLLRSPAAQAYAADNFTGSVNKFLNWKPLANYDFDLPPLEEQARLADILWTIERHRLAVSCAVDALERVQAAWRETVFGAPVETARLDECSRVLLGRQRAPQHAKGEHMRDYVRSANISDGRVSLTDINQMNFTPAEQEKFRLLPGDVLVSEGTASPRQLGSSAMWDPEVPGTEMYFQKTLLRLRAVNGRSTPSLLREWAKWAQESGAFVRVATGTGILHITGVRCAAMPFPVLSAPEQEKLSRQADDLRDASAAIQAEVDRTSLLRDAMISSLFGGS